MTHLAEREPSIIDFLDVLQEQAQASTEALQNNPGRGRSFTVNGGEHTTNSIVYVTDTARGRISSGISSSLPSGLRIHHELNLNTGALGTGIFGDMDQLGDRPKSVVRGTDKVTLQTPRLPLYIQRFMGRAPVSVMRNLGLLKMESVFGEGALIIGVDAKTITILIGKRVIKYEFPSMKLISSADMDTQTRGDLLASIDDKMLTVRRNLAQAQNHFPLPKKKGGNNRPKEFDNDLLS